MEEATDESFVEDAADIDARRMAMKAAEGVHLKLLKLDTTAFYCVDQIDDPLGRADAVELHILSSFSLCPHRQLVSA